MTGGSLAAASQEATCLIVRGVVQPPTTAEGPGEDGGAGAWPFASKARLIHAINCKTYQFNQLPEYSANWTSFSDEYLMHFNSSESQEMKLFPISDCLITFTRYKRLFVLLYVNVDSPQDQTDGKTE